MKVHDDEMLRYYWQELTYLRREGQAFARRYPKIAGRLELEAGTSPDPHVERMIEAFAFLTGRIQYNLDNEFPEIAAELLGILYPHFLAPVPSMTVCRFEVDPDRGKLTTGYEIAPHTPLFVHESGGAICRFRTCYPVVLWPLEVVEAKLVPPDLYPFLDDAPEVATVLRLRLVSRADPIGDLELDRLRFYLNGDAILVSTLYELLMNHCPRVALLPAGARRPRLLGADAITPVGFGLADEVIPYPRFAQPAYRLLQEYFAFPEKYHFFDLDGFSGLEAGETLDVLFLLDFLPRGRLRLDRETFALGCTPIINLFPKTSEPIRVDQRRLEYLLVPDARRHRTTEIHSIVSVVGTSDPAEEPRVYQPFYSFDHAMASADHPTFWHARRRPTPHPDGVGTDLFLSFLDLDFQPSLPPSETIFARLLCTNRDLAGELAAGTVLQTDEAIPAGRIVCLKKPTPQFLPPMGGETLWRLVSHLSLNYLSLSDDDDSLKALREILRLYDFTGSQAAQQQLSGIRGMTQRKVVRRLGTEAWKGFCQGNEVTLRFDESLYVGSSAYLLASVLNRFFALYASTNSFTQLVVTSEQRDGVWKKWPPMVGEKIVR